MNRTTIKLSKNMSNLAKIVDHEVKIAAGERLGFTLIVYTEGRASYVSNVDRMEAIREIKTLLDCWDADMPDIPAHESN